MVESNEELKPTHPGEILREDVLPALKLSVAEAAKKLGVSEEALQEVVDCKRSMWPDLARKVGNDLCGNGAGIWNRMQTRYDAYKPDLRIN